MTDTIPLPPKYENSDQFEESEMTTKNSVTENEVLFLSGSYKIYSDVTIGGGRHFWLKDI